MSDEFTVGTADELGVTGEAIRAFVRAHWPRALVLERPRFYQWQLVDPPANEGRDHSCVVLDRAGELIGYMGVNERPFHLDGRVRRGGELTTWIVSERARGGGVGRRMVSSIQDRHDVLVGMNVTESALAVYLRAGFTFLTGMPRMVRVGDADVARRIGTLSPLGERLFDALPVADAVPFEAAAVVDVAELAGAAEALHASAQTLDRSPATLRWRYVDHPYFSYELFIVRSSGGEAAVVMRTDEVDAVRVVHVVDAFGADVALPAAASFVERHCDETGVDVADFYSVGARFTRFFRERGWVSGLDDAWVQIPHLFQPIDLRSPATNSLVLWAREDMTSLLDFGRVYVSKGDCDIDRPTVDYLERVGVGD